MSGKRSYTQYTGRPSAGYKAARTVGGKVLRYSPSAPVAGSYRSRQGMSLTAAIRRAGELKGMDTALTQASVIATTNTNANSVVLNLVQQGAGSWNRIGRKIHLKSLRLRGEVQWINDGAAGTDNLDANVCRMVVVWDKQPSGAAIPTFDTVFGVTDQTGTESTTFLNPIKYDNMDRFVVLRDCAIDFSPNLWNGGAAAVADTKYKKVFDEYIDMKSKEVVFLGQSNPMTIADISTGALYLAFRANNNSANGTCFNEAGIARLRYRDP